MKKTRDIICSGAIVFLFAFYSFANAGGDVMKISSTAFQENQMIPREFTCQGSDVNPPFTISGIPPMTKSLVLIHDDPDAPMGTWDHWIVFNIPVPTAEEFGIPKDSVPGTQGKNSWGRNDYGGPCPPSGTHRYFFKVHALDAELPLKEGAGKKQVEAAMKGHVLAEAQLIGLYQKT